VTAHDPSVHDKARLAVVIGALGVVFGDIGTSPIYTLQTVFSPDDPHPVPVTTDNVFGVVSLIFWSVMIIITVTYVLLAMRVDNDGEGGIMALIALLRRWGNQNGRKTATILAAVGIFGASLFFGDSMITPAISVLSAVEGLKVVEPSFDELVVPITAVIIVVLFAVQRRGTAAVGKIFGPVMILWFVVIGAAGIAGIVGNPSILKALSPTYAIEFLFGHFGIAFFALAAIVLTVTGAEALYADMGHFGRGPIRRAWFWIVFPALTLNYLAQGALILRDPSARSSPFFLLVPHWAQIPMVVLATAATIIASQAVISGAFSVSRQAVRLGFLPHMRIRHTSESQEGQVFVPAVNAALFVAVVLLVLTFRSSTRLATAYGVAVTGTFLITTALFLAVARALWRWPLWRLVLVGVVFGVVELTYFAANLTKVTHGGWLTLLIAALVFTAMMTWQKGRGIVTARRRDLEGPLPEFIRKVHSGKLPRVPGVAVFPHPTKETTPLALRANLEHNHVLHEHVLILSGSTANVPHIPWERRISIDHLGDPADGIVHIAAEFGFQDRNDFPEVLRRVSAEDAEGLPPDLDPGQVSFFLSRITLRRTRRPGMSTWRKQLFIVMAHNAASQAEFLHLPDDRTVVMGSQVDL
jgi:KUP system potassium uptake protein